MTEDNSLPSVAETRINNQEIPDLIKNIQDFAGNRASVLSLESIIEEKILIIEEKNQFIARQEEYISLLNDHIHEQKCAFEKLQEIVHENCIDACYSVPGSPPTFEDVDDFKK